MFPSWLAIIIIFYFLSGYWLWKLINIFYYCPDPGIEPRSPALQVDSFFFFFHFTILYWFCHISTWIRHRYTRVPHPEPSSHLPPRTIPSSHPSATAPSILYRTWTGDSFLIWYYTCFNALLPNHPPPPLPQSSKDCSIHLCLFCCLAIGLSLPSF